MAKLKLLNSVATKHAEKDSGQERIYVERPGETCWLFGTSLLQAHERHAGYSRRLAAVPFHTKIVTSGAELDTRAAGNRLCRERSGQYTAIGAAHTFQKKDSVLAVTLSSSASPLLAYALPQPQLGYLVWHRSKRLRTLILWPRLCACVTGRGGW